MSNTTEELHAAINKLKRGTSPDSNGIRAEDIKACDDETKVMVLKKGKVADNNGITAEDCEQNTLTRHIFSCFSALMIMSHTTLAQGVSARHTIQVSCACVFDLSSTFSSHSSFVSLIFYFIFLIFPFIFYVDRFGAKPLVRFRE